MKKRRKERKKEEGDEGNRKKRMKRGKERERERELEGIKFPVKLGCTVSRETRLSEFPCPRASSTIPPSNSPNESLTPFDEFHATSC